MGDVSLSEETLGLRKPALGLEEQDFGEHSSSRGHENSTLVLETLTLPPVPAGHRSGASAELNHNSHSSSPAGIHSAAAAVVPREHGLLLLHDGQVLPCHG